MKVKIMPFNYIGDMIEEGALFHTVRLASGALVVAPASFIEKVESTSTESSRTERRKTGETGLSVGEPRPECPELRFGHSYQPVPSLF